MFWKTPSQNEIEELRRQNAALRKYKTNARQSMRAMQAAYVRALRINEILKLKFKNPVAVFNGKTLELGNVVDDAPNRFERLR